MKKVFLFDLDGVVIKTRFFTEKYERDFWVWKEIISDFLKENLVNTQIWKADLKILLQEKLWDFKWEKSVEEFLKYWFEYDNVIDENLLQEIDILRNKWHLCFLCTNQEKYRFEYLINTLHISNYFDEIFSSHIIWYSKSDSLYFSKVLWELKKKYNVNISEIVFFDDKENFIQSATNSWIEWIIYKNIDDFFSYLDTNLQ